MAIHENSRSLLFTKSIAMKRTILLVMVMTSLITASQAQKNSKKEQKLTGYAITAPQKGQTGWKEVRLVDINSGEELQTVYKTAQEIPVLNARTGDAVVKKDLASNNTSYSRTVTTTTATTIRKVVNLDAELDKASGRTVQPQKVVVVYHEGSKVSSDKPFATNSAAMAFDEKHQRLYYTPMSISQLRYIDLKSNKIYYFEDEKFGPLSGPGDVQNQITRMVIASDGNGYALTNDANHLMRFTTGKNPEITDLGALTDDASNGNYSAHSSRGYGGDLIADANGNLYLITANRNVFKFSIQDKVAKYMGTIKGLPQGYSTNGAMVEGGSKVIVCSAESTVGYFRFDLNTMEAEKVSGENVFNASDLANGNLAFEKEKKKKRELKEEKEPVVVNNPPVEQKPEVTELASRNNPVQEVMNKGIMVYPNPVTNGYFRLSFEDQEAGKYQVQLLDLSGKLLRTQDISITGKFQVEEFRLPDMVAKGNYLVKVVNELNKVSVATKLVVQ